MQNEKTTIESENADIKEQLELSSDELNDLRIQYRSLGMYFHIYTVPIPAVFRIRIGLSADSDPIYYIVDPGFSVRNPYVESKKLHLVFSFSQTSIVLFLIAATVPRVSKTP